MRINKYIAHCGYCSRRKAEEYILDSRVSINGKIISDLSTQVYEGDVVMVDGEKLNLVRKKYYLAFNKPRGVISSNYDKFNPINVFDYIDIDTKLFTIGRLDKDSEGLILITNDGTLYNRIIHPSREVKKYYRVIINKRINKDHIKSLERGVDIGGYITNKAQITLIKDMDKPHLDVVITEGKNRQIRRMFSSLGYEVLRLKRYRIGNVHLNNLEIGQYRHLSEGELRELKNYG